jgi:putative MFS transporter
MSTVSGEIPLVDLPTTAPVSGRRATIGHRLERLPMTGYQRRLFAIIATAWFFDSMDLGIMTFVLGSIKAEFGLSAMQTGLLASSSFLGMFLGAATAGMLADRFGRKPVFQLSMIFWGVGSLMCGLSDSANELMGYRVLLGFGMGMEFPIGLAMVSEIVPAKSRGRYVAILEGFWPLGFIAAGITAYFLLPVIGWRGIFIALAVPAVFVFVVRRNIPESPRWLEDAGRIDEADKVMTGFEGHVLRASGMRKLPAVEVKPGETAKPSMARGAAFKELWKGVYAKRTLMLWALWFFALLGYYGLTTWLGALLQQAGYAVTKSVLYTVYISLAGIPGFIFAAWLLEKWGRKPTCMLMLVGSAAAAFMYGQAAATQAPVAQLITAGLCMQFFMFGMWSVLYAYTPELYPTRSRATGAGFASSVGRVGSLVGPYVVGIVLPFTGQAGVFTLGAACFVVAALIVMLFGTETKGQSLEALSH